MQSFKDIEKNEYRFLEKIGEGEVRELQSFYNVKRRGKTMIFTKPNANSYIEYDDAIQKIEKNWNRTFKLILSDLVFVKVPIVGAEDDLTKMQVRVFEGGEYLFYIFAYNSSLHTLALMFRACLDETEKKEFTAIMKEESSQKAVEFLSKNSF